MFSLVIKVENTIDTQPQLVGFMRSVLPTAIPPASPSAKDPTAINQDQLIEDVIDGVRRATMSVRLSPHILSLIDWKQPLSDPLLRQFIPLGSRLLPDHPALRLDSLDETADSPVKGLIHRYPDKAVFLGMWFQVDSLHVYTKFT
jgi:lysine 2,3-aminomutase